MNENFSIDPDPKFILKKKKKKKKILRNKNKFPRINYTSSEKNTFFWKEQESIV